MPRFGKVNLDLGMSKVTIQAGGGFDRVEHDRAADSFVSGEQLCELDHQPMPLPLQVAWSVTGLRQSCGMQQVVAINDQKSSRPAALFG